MAPVPVVLGLARPLLLAITGFIGLVGRIIAFLHIIFRGDLRLVQKLLYVVLLIVPLWWIIYFILGRERTAEFLD